MCFRRDIVPEHKPPKEIWPAVTDAAWVLALMVFVLVLATVRSSTSSKPLGALRLSCVSGGEPAAEPHLADGSLRATVGRATHREQTIADSKQQLSTLASRLQNADVLRARSLSKLRAAMETGRAPWTGSGLLATGDNGNVVISEGVLFDPNSYAIKKQAKPLLDGLARALGELLADATVRESLDAIVIEGHTDDRGSSASTWDLSAKRATAVLDYLFDTNRTLAESYSRYFAASAFSKRRPVNAADTTSPYPQSRRVEVSVVPKDANLGKVFDDCMQTVPAPMPEDPSQP
jgi:chemotaxis protein MotB